MEGLVIKPIRLRNSLYLLIPCQVAKVTEITEDTKFMLKLVHGNQTILKFEKIKDELPSKKRSSLSVEYQN